MQYRGMRENCHSPEDSMTESAVLNAERKDLIYVGGCFLTVLPAESDSGVCFVYKVIRDL